MLVVLSAPLAKMTLTYFPVAARGELARLLAAAGGLDIVDSTNVTDYKATPFGFLPVLDDPEAGLVQLQESLAIERYLAAVAPRFRTLTPAQRAIDDMFACAKEDLMALEPCAVNGSIACANVAPLMDRYLSIFEKRLPAAGFVHGLPYPTGADLATLLVTKAGFPWGRAMRLAGYTDWQRRFPKVVALAERTAAAPAVAAYLASSSTFLARMEPEPPPVAANALLAERRAAASQVYLPLVLGLLSPLQAERSDDATAAARSARAVAVLAALAAAAAAALLALAARRKPRERGCAEVRDADYSLYAAF